MTHIVFRTNRLIIKIPEISSEVINFFISLWANPIVMSNVGFPNGLQKSYDQVKEQLTEESASENEYDRILLIYNIQSELIGNCKLGSPNTEGISITDVKLSPDFWGKRYGQEIKKGLIDYLFKNTVCSIVEASPNKNNFASIKMQESVGGIKIKSFTYKFPDSMKGFTKTVEGYIYHVRRIDWEKQVGLN